MIKKIFNYNKKTHLKQINWKKCFKNVIKIQNRIAKQTENNQIRKVRNLQRLLCKTLSSQLIVSQKIFEIKYRKKEIIYYKEINQKLKNYGIINFTKEFDFESLNLSNIKKIPLNYFYFLYFLWILALLPILETQSTHYFYNYRLYRTQKDFLYHFLYTLNQFNQNWVLIIRISHFFNDKHNQWLLNNCIIEKKFLLFYYQVKNCQTQKFPAQSQNNFFSFFETRISLKKLLQSFSLIETSKTSKLSLIIPALFSYNNFLIIPSTYYIQLFSFQTVLKQFYHTRGLKIKKNQIWKVNLYDGLNFLGWNLQKNKDKVILQINRANIKAHKFELKRLLKLSGHQPIDKVIDRLNKKILYWQYYYSSAINSYQIWSELNSYLFWRIWKWCRKRHKNKGSKWIYQKYWIKNKSQNWVFSMNDHSLALYSAFRKN